MRELFPQKSRCDSAEAGFSLIEAMVAITIFAIGILGAYALQIHATQGNTLANRVSTSANWAAYSIEELLARDYALELTHPDYPGPLFDDQASGPGAGVNGLDNPLPDPEDLANFPVDGVIYIQPDGMAVHDVDPGNAIYTIYYNVAEGSNGGANSAQVLDGVKLIRTHVFRNGGWVMGTFTHILTTKQNGLKVMSENIVKSRANMGEQGFIMVWSLLLLIVVTLLGAAGIATSIFEERMAANEALHKQAFYEADGGTDNALALLVHNINCITGFSPTEANNDIIVDGDIRVDSGSKNFWLSNSLSGDIDMPTDAVYDFLYPSGAVGTSNPRTLGRINGQTQLMTGANLPMLAGYEGKGKALGQDGAYLEYDIKVEHNGTRNNKSQIHTNFRLDNQFASYPAGTCYY